MPPRSETHPHLLMYYFITAEFVFASPVHFDVKICVCYFRTAFNFGFCALIGSDVLGEEKSVVLS